MTQDTKNVIFRVLFIEIKKIIFLGTLILIMSICVPGCVSFRKDAKTTQASNSLFPGKSLDWMCKRIKKSPGKEEYYKLVAELKKNIEEPKVYETFEFLALKFQNHTRGRDAVRVISSLRDIDKKEFSNKILLSIFKQSKSEKLQSEIIRIFMENGTKSTDIFFEIAVKQNTSKEFETLKKDYTLFLQR